MITEVQEHAVASEPELRLDSILNHRERFTRMRECFAGEGKLGAETMVGSIFGDQQFAIGFNLGHLTNDSVPPSEETQTARPLLLIKSNSRPSGSRQNSVSRISGTCNDPSEH